MREESFQFDVLYQEQLYPATPVDTGSIRDGSYRTLMKNSLELIEISSINKVSLVEVSSCCNTGSIRDDPYWTSRKNSLELVELSSIKLV